jgi:hypothetical protein
MPRTRASPPAMRLPGLGLALAHRDRTREGKAHEIACRDDQIIEENLFHDLVGFLKQIGLSK